MPYTLFANKFPQTAATETRSVTVYDHPHLPVGEYGFLEAFCDEPSCDCQRVMFNVYIPQLHTPLAVIAYGWESAGFYAEWFGENNPEIIRELQGPCFNSISYQSPLAPALLEMAKGLLEDEAYVERIKKHYAMFRREIEQKTAPKRSRRPRKPKPKRKKR